jgi:phage terminase large subunit-like protein
MFGLRFGTDPRVVVTTTPRPTKLIRTLIADPTAVVTRGPTYENRANLAPTFLDQIISKYEGHASPARRSRPSFSTMCRVRCGLASSRRRERIDFQRN